MSLAESFGMDGDINDFLGDTQEAELDANPFTPQREERPEDYVTPAVNNQRQRTAHRQTPTAGPLPRARRDSPPDLNYETSPGSTAEHGRKSETPSKSSDVEGDSSPRADLNYSGSHGSSTSGSQQHELLAQSIERPDSDEEVPRADRTSTRTPIRKVERAATNKLTGPAQPRSIFGTPSNVSSGTSVRPQASKTRGRERSKRLEPFIVPDDVEDPDCFIVEVRVARPGEDRTGKAQIKTEPNPDAVIDLDGPQSPQQSQTIELQQPQSPEQTRTIQRPQAPQQSQSPERVQTFQRSPSPQVEMSVEDMLAAQAAIISSVGRQNQSSGPNLVSPTARSRKRRRDSLELHDDSDDVEAAMHADAEDDSWMHADDDESADEEEEYTNAIVHIKELTKLEAKGKLDITSAANLHRYRQLVAARDRLKAAKRSSLDEEENEDEDSLMIPETQRDVTAPLSQSPRDNGEGPSTRPGNQLGIDPQDDHLISVLQGELGKDPATKTRKPRRKAAKNAREFHLIEEEKRREKERSKTQKKKGRLPAGGAKGKKVVEKAKGRPKGKGKGKAKAKGKGRNKETGIKAKEGMCDMRYNYASQGQDQIGQLILDDMINCDPIADRIENPIFQLGPEPAIESSGRKATQLQQLYANVPDGTSKRKAKSDKQKLLHASRSFGFANVKAVEGKWLVKGMNSTLYHHQLLGAQWMVQREFSDDPPHGGLLADSMGLGKTVETLACMVANPPTKVDLERGTKATLIVVPSSVAAQWLDEIKLHVDKKTFPKVMMYKASKNIPEDVMITMLEALDICVTTYHEVMKQFPWPTAEERVQIQNGGYTRWWKKKINSETIGVLHKIRWRRVVLDEAHAIKNNSSRTSLACQNLRSTYRWCLTGTPLLNRLEELFPYLRFLKANYTIDYNTFQRYFCDPDADACNNRIATLLSYAMMRRTMKTTILGRPIVTLPEPHPILSMLDFSREERIIYRITENRFRANLNNFIAKGSIQRAYGVFFVQLLRLRQCTSHLFLLERTIKESWTSEDVEQLRKHLNRLQKTTTPFYEQCKVWVAESEERRKSLRTAESSQTGEDQDMLFGLSDFGANFQFNKALDSLNQEELYSRITCHLCSDIPNSPVITDCHHVFCKNCLTDHLHNQVHMSDEEYKICPHCDEIFSSFAAYTAVHNPDDDNMDGGSDTPSTPKGRGSKRQKSSTASQSRNDDSLSLGRDELGFEPLTKDSTWVTRSDTDPNFPLIPSAKTTALKAALLKGFEDAPDDKVVIYVQFRTLARIIGRICRKENWSFVYLTGDSSLEHRSRAVQAFRDDDRIQIMIAGLKCGGLGLNFPFANRCISLDLWWNHGVEQQAFGRIFRIGQNKETYMTRLVVKNSVDMRMLGMQKYKLKACEKAIDENGEGGSRKKDGGSTLSLGQLCSLFGFLKTDADDNVVSIEADYDDEPRKDTETTREGTEATRDNGEGSIGGVYGEGYERALSQGTSSEDESDN